MKEIKINNIAGLHEAAREFLKAIGDRKVIAFNAPMGAGKTTLIGEICRQLGVEDDISSPTFAIVNDYESRATGDHIYHFDCYRLDDPREAEDMGIEDYLYSGNLCLIEWPDRVEEFLPDDTLCVSIRINPDDSRSVILCPA
ncbi:MAG: tRNA (adenosine(37)-N6)-threonylcarbamoyltransferase complex ATPase subunit type 1 TsaE [Muribaculaceae bacterium]|nr:tRNA (adenosine(37)-N6)-threonylcarbamoyltransferase complex ATPase subunit type 1 TsaE [Muribaculaceae bacterium]